MSENELEKVNIDGEPIAETAPDVETPVELDAPPTATEETALVAAETETAPEPPVEEVAVQEETLAAPEPIAIEETTTTADNDDLPVIETTEAEPFNEEPAAEATEEENVEAAEFSEETTIESTEDSALNADEDFSETGESNDSANAHSSTTLSQKPPRKKFKFRKWMLIPACILAAVFFTGLILGLIPQRAFYNSVNPAGHDWIFVNIFDAQSSTSPVTTIFNDGTPEMRELFDKGIVGTRHSALRSLFEGNFTNSLRFATTENTTETPRFNEDGEWEFDDLDNPMFDETTTTDRILLRHNDVIARTQTEPGTFVLEFVFATQSDSLRHIDNLYNPNALDNGFRLPYVTVRDNSTSARESGERNVKIYFDRIRILINDSLNSIQEYQMFFFNSMALTPPGGIRNYLSEYATYATPVFVRMNTTSLYTRLLDIREHFRFNRDNGEFVAPEVELPPEEDEDDWGNYDFM